MQTAISKWREKAFSPTLENNVYDSIVWKQEESLNGEEEVKSDMPVFLGVAITMRRGSSDWYLLCLLCVTGWW